LSETKAAVVLVRPEESKNVGAVCRAMANCALTDLRIVGWREDYRDIEVRSLALHAQDLWEGARFYESLTDAAADCVFSAGATRRRGKLRKGKLLLPEELASRYTAVSTAGGTVALVFGCERTGLTDEELSECTLGVTIPSDDRFPSLNLSHAVQILCYELYRAERRRIGATQPLSPGSVPVTLERLDTAVDALIADLRTMGFFSVHPSDDMTRFWRDILSRSALSEGEAAYLEHIFHKAAGLSKATVSRYTS
jgi:tRNA/rRNA methyltransferase